MSKDLFEIFRVRMRELRLLRGLTLLDLSKACDSRESTMQRYETGSIKKVPAAFVSKIADALDCDVDYLWGHTDEPRTVSNNETLTSDESCLIAKYRSISNESRDIIQDLIDYMYNVETKNKAKKISNLINEEE